MRVALTTWKQLGLADYGYPRADRLDSPAQLVARQQLAGLVGGSPMLPYLEQTAMYNALNFGLTMTNGGAIDSAGTAGFAENSTVTRATLSFLLCPSDTDRLTSTFGHCNYVGNAAPRLSFDKADYYMGVFMESDAFPAGVSVATITRRHSDNTAAFSERVKGIGSGAANTPDVMNPTSSTTSIATPSDVTQPAIGYAHHLEARHDQPVERPVAGPGVAHRLPVRHPLQPRHAPQHLGLRLSSRTTATYRGSSVPAAGTQDVVNVGMAAGSVRAIKSSIFKPQVWWALGTCSNGEVIDASSY